MPTTYHKTIHPQKRFPKERNYDLLDIHDKKITMGTKDDAKRLRLWRRVVHIFIFNNKNELLICKRPASKDAYPNLITSSAGGHVELGESYHVAAKRELYEELGLSTHLKNIGRFDITGLHGKMIHHLFIGRSADKIRPDPKEISSYKFATVASLIKEIRARPKKFTPPFRKAFALYLRHQAKKQSDK